MPQKCGSSCSAVFRLNKETFFLAEIFICSESQSSSLKWSGHNVFVLLFFFCNTMGMAEYRDCNGIILKLAIKKMDNMKLMLM